MPDATGCHEMANESRRVTTNDIDARSSSRRQAGATAVADQPPVY